MKEDQLDPELREGEYIRWQGRTGAFSLLEPLARRTILGKWLCTLVAGGVLLALAGREDAGVGPAAAIAIVLGTAALLAAPVLEWWALRGQHYWITNERAIAMTREHRICSMELKEIDDVCLVQGENGMHSLNFGRGSWRNKEANALVCVSSSGTASARRSGRPGGEYGILWIAECKGCPCMACARTGCGGCLEMQT